MRHSDFKIGETFFFGERAWRCTDVGTRTVAAIRLDGIEVVSVTMEEGEDGPETRRTLTQEEAMREGWFTGPPYGVAELVFDEYHMPACSFLPDPTAPQAPQALPVPQA